MVNQWRKQLKERSGNLTTNESMPAELIQKILEEDESLKDKVTFEPIEFPGLSGTLGNIQGLHILAGLQAVQKPGCLTVFRGIRFPTYKRMYEVVSEYGYSLPNYEQERILELYQRPEYLQKREESIQDPHFWTQPQERVVQGLPIFHLVNDALQIHRAFRGEKDQSLIVAIHIPQELLKENKIQLIANTAIDLDYQNAERDYEIKSFNQDEEIYGIDFESLQAHGIDLHEMYTKDLPDTAEKATTLGITQDFFLLDIYKIKKDEHYKALFNDTKTLKENKHFLHGFFGDQNIFARRESTYLPSRCQRVSLIKTSV